MYSLSKLTCNTCFNFRSILPPVKDNKNVICSPVVNYQNIKQFFATLLEFFYVLVNYDWFTFYKSHFHCLFQGLNQPLKLKQVGSVGSICSIKSPIQFFFRINYLYSKCRLGRLAPNSMPNPDAGWSSS